MPRAGSAPRVNRAISMLCSLRHLFILAILASLFVGGPLFVKADDDVYDDEPSEDKPNVEPLVPDAESLIPRFEPDAAEEAGPDTGFTPYRWLDENYQFLNEGDPYPPGQDPFRERPGLPVGWFAG